jgi:hypothetical protein
MLERTIDAGDAPVLAAIRERGFYTPELVSAFPSVTPVCAAAIATGVLQDEHGIAGMNWYSRAEGRYVEYGSSFRAAKRFGIAKQLVDTVYRMNMEHLAADVETVFESLDDAHVRTAGTTYLMYRGRHRHSVVRQGPLTRLAAGLFRNPILGPRELFYADLYATRETPCRSRLGSPGIRDQHSGCVGAHLVEHDLFDFLLLSLPDNDNHSHKHGPEAQPESIAAADRQLWRLVQAAGGLEQFLDAHAVIVCADHSHALVERRISLPDAFSEWRIAGPGPTGHDRAQLALCPNQRAAMLYLLEKGDRAAELARLVGTAVAVDGVDLVAWREDETAVVQGPAGRTEFTPGGDHADARGNGWSVRGEPLDEATYPDGYRRLWAALRCERSGDLLLSATPGWEFTDWGGADHVGGGSHGSLHHSDSFGALLFSGLDHVPGLREPDGRRWSITDVAGMVRAFHGLGSLPWVR